MRLVILDDALLLLNLAPICGRGCIIHACIAQSILTAGAL
jgi:hypothetical protein